MLSDWNFWVTLVTAATAVIALFQTAHQTKLGNKQYLFDRRLKAYLIARGLFNLCKQNYEHLLSGKRDKPYFENDLVFTWLTNNAHLYQVTDVIKHPLELPFQLEFLKKLEALKELSSEIKLIFHGKTAMIYGDFVSAYQEVLFSIYQYQIILDKMQEANNTNPMSAQEAAKIFDEPKYQQCLADKMCHLKETYDLVEKAESKGTIQKQITLK